MSTGSLPPPPAQPRGMSLRPTPTRRSWLIPVVLLVIVLLVARACSTAETRNEKMVRAFTAAVQNDDLAEVQKLENSGTAADMSRLSLGKAADALGPLGAIKRVKEVTPKDDPPRIHEFDVTFAKGSVHEKVELDPNGKIFHFHYDQPQTGS
ncbi:MAG TPA: hypothetical protein VMD91_01215 [Candidatus Sulfotelmatobacter sp.]|nr:hypothetical protein [Candidatus Sulfotelmatobacter sp.]